ncbi:hypothetical protein PCH_Pc20g15020 [Penicillium rubens Wisconsin 54-1255]|uniref:Uncharacterized protein n=1 Tax=Penicillium rubens (strain ATCC 28089 / DSM 1075 / NRRL 1951 / Wisconsin 54-1255) TaxID=500485 RepID=B6HDV8_PENRW|nr:hypothetical protein PCH_Pc20g15020 [Penicillium rubens Wisconsin 54-1255]
MTPSVRSSAYCLIETPITPTQQLGNYPAEESIREDDSQHSTPRGAWHSTVIYPHAALNIQVERGWKYGPVKWHRKTYFSTGRPDYRVWYGEEEEVSLNVVVEAKRQEGAVVSINLYKVIPF